MAPLPFAPGHRRIEDTVDWRTSGLPTSDLKEVKDFGVDWPAPPDYKHQWLPMRNSTLEDTPIRDGHECSGLPRWQCGTIAHYSLFQRLEASTYHFLL